MSFSRLSFCSLVKSSSLHGTTLAPVGEGTPLSTDSDESFSGTAAGGGGGASASFFSCSALIAAVGSSVDLDMLASFSVNSLHLFREPRAA